MSGLDIIRFQATFLSRTYASQPYARGSVNHVPEFRVVSELHHASTNCRMTLLMSRRRTSFTRHATQQGGLQNSLMWIADHHIPSCAELQPTTSMILDDRSPPLTSRLLELSAFSEFCHPSRGTLGGGPSASFQNIGSGKWPAVTGHRTSTRPWFHQSLDASSQCRQRLGTPRWVWGPPSRTTRHSDHFGFREVWKGILRYLAGS